MSDLLGSKISKCHPELVSGSYNSVALSQFIQVGSCLIIKNQIGRNRALLGHKITKNIFKSG